MTRSPLLLLGVVLCSLTAAAGTKPSPLQQAKALYDGLEYEKCLTRLDAAAKQATSATDQAQVELYGGLCNFNIGNLDDAQRRFDLGLELDPSLKLPPDTSPRISELFEASRAKAQKKLAKQQPPPRQVEKADKVDDAPREAQLTPKVEHLEEPPQVIAEEEDGEHSYVAPVALAGVSALSLGAGAYFGLQAKEYELQANSAHFSSDAFHLGQQANSSAMIANVGFGVAATAAIGAAVAYFVAD